MSARRLETSEGVVSDNTMFIVAAFAVTWVALLGYARHLRRVRLEAHRRLEQANADVSGGRR